MTLVDSSVWIDYINAVDNRWTQILDTLLGVEDVIMGDLILTEVLQGFKSDSELKKVLHFFNLLECHQLCDYHVAIESANNFRRLRKNGYTVRKTIDCIIATFCISKKIRLLHNDKDFNCFEKHLGLLCY